MTEYSHTFDDVGRRILFNIGSMDICVGQKMVLSALSFINLNLEVYHHVHNGIDGVFIVSYRGSHGEETYYFEDDY